MEYSTKYNRGQEVFALSERKVITSKIDAIKITDKGPYINVDDHMKLSEKSGITIEYLIRVEHEQFTTGSFRSSYDWFNEEFVFTSKEELLQKIV
jgi:hypothetical protein